MERLPPNLRLAASALTRHPRALLASHDVREAWDECFVCARFAFRVPSALGPFDARALVRVRVVHVRDHNEGRGDFGRTICYFLEILSSLIL